MTRKQFIQIWQFVLARIAIGCFVVFVMKESFVDFLLRYWLLWLILSVSYFYYYSIEYETDKKYETIRNILIYWNIYLLAHIFFRPLLNIEHALFVLLWLILVWLWRTTKMKTNRIKTNKIPIKKEIKKEKDINKINIDYQKIIKNSPRIKKEEKEKSMIYQKPKLHNLLCKCIWKY